MLDFLSELWNKFSSMLLSLLPRSPFVDFLNSIEYIPYLGWLNWFVPVGDIIVIGGVFLSAVGLFYLYMIIARWLKVIGD